MNSPLLSSAARCYGLDAADLSPLSGGHVSQVYEFARDAGSYVLRITPPDSGISPQAMRAILHWMRALADHDVPVAAPTPSVNGHLVETIAADGQTYLITASEKAPGVLAERMPLNVWNDLLFRRMGQLAGQMHAVAQEYAPPEPALRRPAWDEAGNCFNEPLPDALAASRLAEQRAGVLARVQALPKDAECYGMIHADFHAANFFVDATEHRITVFDFDDCVYGWYAMDIAMPLFDMLVVYPQADKAAFAERVLTHFLSGYQEARPITPFWIARLPLFLKLLEISIYAQVYTFYDPEDHLSWVGKFMRGRRQRIEDGVPYVDLDFRRVGEQVQAS